MGTPYSIACISSLMAAPPPGLQNGRMLYIPGEGVDWEPPTQHLVAADFPIPGLPPGQFPFPRPILFHTDPTNAATFNTAYRADPVQFGAQELALAPRSTKPDARSQPTRRVQNNAAKGGHRLKKVLRSAEMWNRIIEFVLARTQQRLVHPDPTVPVVNGQSLNDTPPNIPPLDNPLPPMQANGWDENGIPFVEPGRMAQAIFALHSHYSSQLRQGVTFVNSETAVEIEFFTRFLLPANLWLEVCLFLPIS